MAQTVNTHPQTLLELAGAGGDWQRPTPGETAVLLIDVQAEYLSGRLPLEGVEAALKEIARLRACADELGIQVAHIWHQGAPGGLFDETGKGQFCAEAKPAAGERVISKKLPNAFTGTTLAADLEQGSVKNIIVGGFMSHMCVSSTVRAGLDLGLSATVIASACASRALPVPTGGVLSGEMVHKAAMAALADRFATVLPDVSFI